MKYMHRERKGRKFTELTICNLKAQIERVRALKNPNQLYLDGLETLLRSYERGKGPR